MTLPTRKLIDLLETCDTGVWGKPAVKGKGLLILRSTNMSNDGKLDFSNVAERNIKGDINKLKLLAGDILVEKSGGGPNQPVGRVAYFTAPDDEVYTFANFIQRLRAKFDLIDSRFLFYCLLFLHKIGFTKKLQSQTTGIRNLKLSLYLKTEIPAPPIKIQKQIIERLDKIVEAQKLNDSLIQKTDELFQSLLNKELDPTGKNWEMKKLGETFDRITESILPTKQPDQKFNFVGLENMESNTGQIAGIKPIKGKLIRSTKTMFKKDNILYGKLRPYLNKVWLADNHGICSTDIWVLRAKQNVILPLLLSSILRQPQIVAKSSASMTGANLPRTNKNVFDNIKISPPPLKEQKQIVTKLSAIQKYKKQLLEQRAEFKELFDSVLSKSLRGDV
ncbi:MAG: restriction endonuclease subunit S [Candidatus Portnoybacteria bacterium]|nr:restriction endonuclease subunit S [Candidatus Portnoybacteria bacterium]